MATRAQQIRLGIFFLVSLSVLALFFIVVAGSHLLSQRDTYYIESNSPVSGLNKGADETIIDQLKNISQIEHTRHRSPINFMVNLLGGLIAYCHQPKKPALKIQKYLGLRLGSSSLAESRTLRSRRIISPLW